MKKNLFTLYSISRTLAIIIMFWTLWYKFSAHPNSVALFTSIDMEPTGRIGVGIAELIAGILLILGKSYTLYGAIIGAGLMIGAIYFHVTVIGYNALFGMACIALVSCLYIIWNEIIQRKHPLGNILFGIQ